MTTTNALRTQANLVEEQEPLLPSHVPHRHHFHMVQNPSVYSTILYAPAISRIKTGNEMGTGPRLACALIVLNMTLQLGLLRIMDIYGHRDAQHFVSGLVVSEGPNIHKETYEAFLTPHERKVVEASGVKPLCTVSSNGTYSCMPSSIQFVSQWPDLDLDGDGVWTMSEAVAAEKKMDEQQGKKMSTNTEEWMSKSPTLFFNHIVNGIRMRAAFTENNHNQTFYVSRDLENKLAIPKAYFEYWMGDAMMCTHFDQSSCENIVASGLFDEALTSGRMGAAHKGVVDLDSATRYCRMMLQSGGGCEQSLPASFTEDILTRRKMCGATSLHASGTMVNPHDATEVMPVMKPSFEILQQQKRASDPMFLFFKVLIMYLFFSSLIDEIRDLITTLEFLVRFPGVKNAADRGGLSLADELQGRDNKKLRIVAISRKHRALLIIVFVCRVVIVCILTSFGTWFLCNEGRYIELVLNALALSFITGIDEVMFNFLESSEKTQDGLDDVETVKFPTSLPPLDSWAGCCFRKEFWALLLIPIVSVTVVLWNAHIVRQPLIEALTCTCLQEGDHCAESMNFQAPWWKEYWGHILPAAVHRIEALRLQGM